MAQSRSMSDPRVLLVDDEQSFRTLLAKRLGRRNIETLQAGTGEECLALLETESVDVVVLDVRMPGMSGIDVIRQLPRKGRRPEIILLTGHASAQDGVEGMKSGAFDYLTKPVDFNHLLGKIRQAYDAVLRDEERRMEEQFRIQMEESLVAAQRLASLGTMAAGVAHEINNPLAIMNDAAGWLKSLLEEDDARDFVHRDQFLKGLGMIEKSVVRAKKITHQLLSFARKEDAAIVETDLVPLCEESLGLVAKEAKTWDITLGMEVNPEAKAIITDPSKIRQVLVNLLTNAIHATPKGGRVVLGLEPTEDGGAVLTVTDTGQGIPEENLDKIFEPFFSTKSSDKGTGLGLFITGGIVRALGGTITVDSIVDKGTTFTIRLPDNAGKAAPGGSAHATARNLYCGTTGQE